jgi:hypothetical protein
MYLVVISFYFIFIFIIVSKRRHLIIFKESSCTTLRFIFTNNKLKIKKSTKSLQLVYNKLSNLHHVPDYNSAMTNFYATEPPRVRYDKARATLPGLGSTVLGTGATVLVGGTGGFGTWEDLTMRAGLGLTTTAGEGAGRA